VSLRFDVITFSPDVCGAHGVGELPARAGSGIVADRMLEPETMDARTRIERWMTGPTAVAPGW